jgi:hypothetical protein
MSNKFPELLKKYTAIDHNFIDTFFSNFQIRDDLVFAITDTSIAKYLNITINILRERLCNKYSNGEKYIYNVDYIKVRKDKSSQLTYLLNYQCFERIAMAGHTPESESVRMYFIQLRKFLSENQNVMGQAITKKQDLRKYNKFETIYFSAIDKRYNNINKLERAGGENGILSRIRDYNVGKIEEIDLKYIVLVKNAILIEACIKKKLFSQQLYDGTEIYVVSLKKIKEVIDYCYCTNITNEEHAELQKEIADLLGFYSYT